MAYEFSQGEAGPVSSLQNLCANQSTLQHEFHICSLQFLQSIPSGFSEDNVQRSWPLALSPTWQTWILSGSQTVLLATPWEKRKVYSKIQTTQWPNLAKGKGWKGQTRTHRKNHEKPSLEFAESNLVKFCKKSSQHMQKTPGSSPWILQCSSGSHRISFQSQTLQETTLRQHIHQVHLRVLLHVCSFANSFQQGRKGCQGCAGSQQPAPLPLVQSHHTRHFGPKGSAISPASAIWVQRCGWPRLKKGQGWIGTRLPLQTSEYAPVRRSSPTKSHQVPPFPSKSHLLVWSKTGTKSSRV